MTIERFRFDLELAPDDAALHRVLAACHRRRVTIDSLEFRRSSTANRIVMDVLMAPTRVEFIGNVLQGEPTVLRCTTSLVEPSAAQVAG